MIDFKKTRDNYILELEKFQIIQENFLMNLIQKNKNTRYGKRYGFSDIKSVKDYQNSTSITSYEDYKEYIKEIIQGENNILTKDKVHLIEPTSGSSGNVKFIPYTNDLKKDFIKAIEAWFCDLLLTYPKILNHKQYWSMTPAVKHNLEKCKLKIGFENDIEYIGDNLKKIFKDKVINVDCDDDFMFETAKAIIKENVSFIFVWSPTYLLILFDKIKEMNPHFSFNNLELISCWADGNSKPYYKKIKKIFKNVNIQEKGLLATEAIMTIPIEGIGKIPCISSCFFEFRDITTNKILLLKDLKIICIYQQQLKMIYGNNMLY